MSAHTPGPWRAGTHEDWLQIYGKDGNRVAESIIAFRDSMEAGLNARLIAAAPDLLELAHAFREYVYDGSRSERRAAEYLRQCDEIIAKAEGKP